MERVRRRHPRRRAGQLHAHGARPGGRLRDREGRAGGDLLAALQLRRGHARPALLPPALQRAGGLAEVVLQGGREDAADLQLVLHRQRAHRDVHQRQAADPRSRRRSRPAHPRHRQVRVAGVPRRAEDHMQGIDPRDGTIVELEPGRRPRLRRPRQRLRQERLGGPQRPADQDARPARRRERQVDPRLGDGGDERRRDAGHAGDRHRAAAAASCSPGRPRRTTRRPRCCR